MGMTGPGSKAAEGNQHSFQKHWKHTRRVCSVENWEQS